MELDIMHGITRWIDATSIEMGQIDEYDTFKDLCKESSAPVVCKNIWFQLVYDINNYGRHKSRLVTDGNLNGIPVESFYSDIFTSVVSVSFYLFLSSIKWKRGLQILETHTFRKRHLKKFTSYEGLDLVIGKAKLSLLPRHYMVSGFLDFDGVKFLLVLLEVRDSSCESWNLTSG